MEKPLLWIIAGVTLVFLLMATQLLLPVTFQEIFSILLVSIVIGSIIGVIASILHRYIMTRKKKLAKNIVKRSEKENGKVSYSELLID